MEEGVSDVTPFLQKDCQFHHTESQEAGSGLYWWIFYMLETILFLPNPVSLEGAGKTSSALFSLIPYCMMYCISGNPQT